MIRFESRREFSFTPEEVWPCLSKTDWLNRSLRIPAVNYQIEPRPEGGSWIRAESKLPIGSLRWRELPFEWMEPEFYRVRRLFDSGPLAEARMGMNLLRQPNGRTLVTSYAELTPKGVIGFSLVKYILGPKMTRDMAQLMAHTEEFLRGKVQLVFPRLPLHPADETALGIGIEKLEEADLPAGLIAKLQEFLRKTPDVEMTHIRPFAVAKTWNEDQWKVVSLFLHATHCGLLNLRWEVLCPNCRSSREMPVTSLAQLKRSSHCDVCQIEFDAEFDKSVELKFAVNPAVRPLSDQTFCLAGPGGKPHVVCQSWLEAGEKRIGHLPDRTRPLRLQSPQVKTPLNLEGGENWRPDANVTITCGPGQFTLKGEMRGEAPPTSQVVNPNSFPILLSWQQTEWSEDILTAARATNCQEFRDLFAREVISPTEQVTIGSQVIMFTDLRGSTAMYHGLGDGPAYALVRNHFLILTEAISSHHGTVVKTIGDAVMAAFSRVDEALDAVQESFARISANEHGAEERLCLKCSLHVGSCLAVNANDKLDFFGTAVNLAARMVGCCEGGDLTVSDEFYNRPETIAFVRKHQYQPEPSEIQFRGFSSPHRVWRLKMGT